MIITGCVHDVPVMITVVALVVCVMCLEHKQTMDVMSSRWWEARGDSSDTLA